MASAVALLLYMQLPREAFESERVKEQMLIDRGEQYKRAIYLYYVSNNSQWPSKLEDLESTNSHRYLRERFVDPYSGKADWRLIHTNGAFLTDSLVTPPPTQGTPGVQGGALAGTGAATPSNGFSLNSPLTAEATANPNAPPPVNALAQRRASDQTMVQNSSYQNIAGGAPAAPGPQSGNDPGYQPFNPAALPPISLYPNGYNAPAAGAPGAPGTNQPGTNQPGTNQPGANQPGVNPAGVNPGMNANQPGGVNPNTQPGVNPFSGSNPFVNPNAGPLANAGMGGANPGATTSGIANPGINQTGANPGAPSPVTLPGTNFPMTNQGFVPPNLSTSGLNQPTAVGSQQQNPNQFGFSNPVSNANPFAPQQLSSGNAGAPPGVPGFGGAPGASNQAMGLISGLLTQPRQPPPGIGPNQAPTGGGGLAGVASTYQGVTIKSYGDRTKYQEWEFVFQLSQLNQQGPGLQSPQGPNGSGGVPNGGILGAGQTPNGAPGAPGTTGPASPFPGGPGIGGTPAQNSPFGSSNPFGNSGAPGGPGTPNPPPGAFGATPTP